MKILPRDHFLVQVGLEVRRKISEQVHAVRRVRRVNDPFLCELLVPRELGEVRSAEREGVRGGGGEGGKR